MSDDVITHLSLHGEIRLVGENIRLPVEIHKTYCGIEVRPSEIDNQNPTCDNCQDWMTWNEIDKIGGHNV